MGASLQHECGQLFWNPQSYLIGAGAGLAVAVVGSVTNPLAGILMGLPFGPLGLFIYNNFDHWGNTPVAMAARAALSVFTSIAIVTAYAAALGFAITSAHAYILMVATMATAAAIAALMMSH